MNSTDEPKRLVCPNCESADGLWANANFSGWCAVDAFEATSPRDRLQRVKRGHPSEEVDLHEADLDHYDMGCSCGWEGSHSDLVRLGVDGVRLPSVHPQQARLEVACDHS